MRRLGSLRSMVRCGAWSGLVLLLASCAGPAKLAQQSDEALAHGDLHKAYDRALRAIEKDPQNQPAREAYTAAGTNGYFYAPAAFLPGKETIHQKILFLLHAIKPGFSG